MNLQLNECNKKFVRLLKHLLTFRRKQKVESHFEGLPLNGNGTKSLHETDNNHGPFQKGHLT